MIDTQILTDALATVAFLVGLVVVISAWAVTASALHRRNARTTQIRVIEQHLADVAEQSPAPVR